MVISITNGIYLALGDSLTTGYGVGFNRSFATLYYAGLLSSFPRLRYENSGVNGLTSGQLVNMIEQSTMYRMISQAQFITITIGSNDLLAIGKGLVAGQRANINLTFGEFHHNLMALGERIRSANPTAILKLASIYNPLPDGDRQTNALARTLVKEANHGVKQMASAYRGIVVPIAKAFKGKEQLMLGSDQLHPSMLGHQVMAECFLRY
ncbi:lysophospholipase L1-like esterase [Desulfitobacterium dichloroeliminans LMG P-21439]|uniref:Lysophospholipase L1-like esterase n=1 Tax=Desulfitobacterium dichloroeliminans (strain LMG P-21439 / DCA1) TaxID=871963 RepID=L0FBT6_DESDL|nr:GDSL-type esterase/lipase family protein [Desulfitobacterium dichloroeliminans]AGA70408.1 lysophospholipase L1-like esterase [Desulfitobacterium dichloroeliminans LMG P-21439]